MNALIVEPGSSLLGLEDVIDNNDRAGIGERPSRNEADCPAATREKDAATVDKHKDLRQGCVLVGSVDRRYATHIILV